MVLSTASFGQGATKLLLYRGLGFGLAVVSSATVARYLGVERFGAYAYAMGMAAVLLLVPNGINMVVTKGIAGDPGPTRTFMRAAFRSQALLAGTLLVGIPCLVSLLPSQPVPIWYVVLAVGQFAVNTLSWTYIAILVGKTRFDLLSTAEFATRAIETALIIGAVVLYGTVSAVLFSHVFSACANFLIVRYVASPFRSSVQGEPVSVRSILRRSMPFSFTATIQSVYNRIDVLLLGQMAGAATVGLYSAAYRPISLLAYLGGSIGGSLFPVMVGSDEDKSRTIFRETVRLLGIIGPPMAIIFTGLARPLLVLIYGHAYSSADTILILLVWATIAFWLYNPLATVLQARGRERAWLKGPLVALCINIVGNIYAIPRWGAVGAAAVTVFSEVALLAIGIFMCRKFLGIKPDPRTVAVILGATLMAVFTLFILFGPAGRWVAILLSLSVYASVVVYSGLVSRADALALAGWVRQAFPVLARRP